MKFHLKRRLIKKKKKIVRDDGTPEYIARGWSIGVFVGCLMPICSQLLVSIPLSFLLRGSKIGAALGTLLTNPVSIFFIYPPQCYVGNKLIGGSLSFEMIKESLKELFREKSWDSFLHMSGELIASFFAGGLLMGVILTPIAYIAVFQMVVRYRKFRAARRLRRGTMPAK